MEHTQRFTGRAQNYTQGRPSYPKVLLDCLYQELGLSERPVIADIGAGTGKFTRLLLEWGSTVYAVEPNEDMREVAVRELSSYERFHPVAGTDAATCLPERSVELVTVAQAFHWFDGQSFRRECQRILKPGGKVALIWNMRDLLSPENEAVLKVYQRYCADFHGFNGGIQKDDPRIRRFFREKYNGMTFANPLIYDKEKFIRRSLSSSYSLKADDEQYEAYLSALEAVFDGYAVAGKMMVTNETVMYVGGVEL